MRHLSLCSLALFFPLILFAQRVDRIKADPSYVWAEESGDSLSEADEAALDGLVRLLAATDALPLPDAVRHRVWETYKPDIRKCSARLSESSGSVIRFMEWDRIPEIFASRRKKVRELTDSAERSLRQGDPGSARCYCAWAETYLTSLPPGETALRDRLLHLRATLGEGEVTPVRMKNIESETAAIRKSLGRADNSRPAQPRASSSPVKEAPEPCQEPVSNRPVIETILPVSTFFAPKLDLPSHRDLLGAPATVQRVPSMTERHPWLITLSAIAECDRHPAAGLMLGVSRERLGGYLSARSSWTSGKADYSCRSDGVTDFGYLWASGRSRYHRTSFTGGMTLAVTSSFALFAGAGYGRMDVLWEDTRASWARVEDLSDRGLLAECGVTFPIRSFRLSAGISSLDFRRYSLLFGLGWTLNDRK